jgi:hypothetical protein
MPREYLLCFAERQYFAAILAYYEQLLTADGAKLLFVTGTSGSRKNRKGSLLRRNKYWPYRHPAPTPHVEKL